jgi:hypothetical protein
MRQWSSGHLTRGKNMNTHELVIEMKLLERRLTLYEEKYGILSQDFYDALHKGQLERYDEYDETRADFSRWRGIYETWQRRKEKYEAQFHGQGEGDPSDVVFNLALLSESALEGDWLRPEEDEAWSQLAQVPSL